MKKDRHYKLNTKKKEKWLELYKNSGSFTNTCISIGISRTAVYDLLKADKEFLNKKEDIDNLIDDAVESRLYALTKKNAIACFFWLCNRRPDRWKNVQKLEHTGNPDEPIKIIYEPANKSKNNKDIQKKQRK